MKNLLRDEIKKYADASNIFKSALSEIISSLINLKEPASKVMEFAMTAVCENVLRARESSAWARVLLARRNQHCVWIKRFPESFGVFSESFSDTYQDAANDYDKKLNAAFVKHMVHLQLTFTS